MKRVSIKDVAARAGTSIATVSKVLNDMPDSGVPEETAQRVRRAARELRYVPLSSAQNLRRLRTQTVAIMVDEVNLFSNDIIKGAESGASEHQLTTVLAVHREDSELEARQLLMGFRGQVDALIVMPARASRNLHLYGELRERGVPIVFVDRDIPGSGVHYIGLQNEEAAYRLTRAMIRQGADVIGTLFTMGGISALTERLAGFRRALAEAGLPQDEDLIAPLESEGLVQVLKRLLVRRPPVNGLFWPSYEYIQPLLILLAEQGLQVPDDIRFAGFDKVALSLSSREDYQALQVIQRPWPAAIQPGFEMGRRALEVLAHCLAEGAPDTPQRIVLEPSYEWLGSEKGGEAETGS